MSFKKALMWHQKQWFVNKKKELKYFIAWLNYKKDRFMQMPGASPVLLIILWLSSILVGGLVLAIGHDDKEWNYIFFRSWQIILDPPAHFDEIDVSGLAFAVSILVVITGLVMTGLIIGFLTETIVHYMDELRAGNGSVVERDHFVILGWNDKIPSILQNCAFAEDRRARIVILADMEKEKMDHAISLLNFPPNSALDIITKSGNPLCPSELRKVSVPAARSIIVLADGVRGEGADAYTIMKTISALSFKDLQGFIVAEVNGRDKVQLLQATGGPRVIPVYSAELIGRLLCACGRLPGLAGVYTGILSFEGTDFYMKEWPSLVGKTFGEIPYWFDDGCVVCGIMKLPSESEKSVKFRFDPKALMFNPSDDYVIKPGDNIVVLSENIDTYNIRQERLKLTDFDTNLPQYSPKDRLPSRILIVGWRPEMDTTVKDLAAFLLPDSSITIVDSCPISNRGLDKRSHVAALVPLLDRDPMFNSIFIMCDKPSVCTSDISEAADNRSAVITLSVNNILRGRIGPKRQSPSIMALASDGTLHPPMIVSEINDTEKMNLVSAFQESENDWVVGNELVGMAMAQLAHNYYARFIQEDLLTPDGNEVYINDFRFYGIPGVPVTFLELWARGRKCPWGREIIIGYKKKGQRAVINPAEKCVKLMFEIGDELVTIAENGPLKPQE